MRKVATWTKERKDEKMKERKRERLEEKREREKGTKIEKYQFVCMAELSSKKEVILKKYLKNIVTNLWISSVKFARDNQIVET